MTTDELAARLDERFNSLEKRFDKMEDTANCQWRYINQHAQQLAVLNNHDKERNKRAAKFGGFAGGIIWFLIEALKFLKKFV